MRFNRRPISMVRIIMVSLLTSFFVLAVSLIIQWLVYDDWLHRTGPLRIVGTSIAALITFGSMLSWQSAVRERQRELMRRFEMISHMNDRIRNALQAIECVAYIAQPEATEIVRREVDCIDRVLRNVLLDERTYAPNRAQKNGAQASRKTA